MPEFIDFVNPALVVLVPVLLFIGYAIKRTGRIDPRHIPLLLGVAGVLLALLWVLSTSAIATWQEALMAAWTALVQGLLVAAMAVYLHQVKKQEVDWK